MSGLVVALIVTVSTLAYLAGWFACTVAGARWLSRNCAPECHGEGPSRYNWGKDKEGRRYCLKNDRKGCWRPSPGITPQRVAIAGSYALVWPLSLVPLAAFVYASREPATADQAVIDRLERELGMTP